MYIIFHGILSNSAFDKIWPEEEQFVPLSFQEKLYCLTRRVSITRETRCHNDATANILRKWCTSRETRETENAEGRGMYELVYVCMTGARHSVIMSESWTAYLWSPTARTPRIIIHLTSVICKLDRIDSTGCRFDPLAADAYHLPRLVVEKSIGRLLEGFLREKPALLLRGGNLELSFAPE